MIHDSLCIPEKMNLSSMKHNGMDSLIHCNKKLHFIKYSKKISYQYNSRGFRDIEWGNDELISQRIWCVGDSFTVGVGQPLSERWTSLLQKTSDKHTINISMDGASNDWISRKSCYILNNIKPEYIVIQWSYIVRRESKNSTLSDIKRRIRYDDLLVDQYDCKNFIDAFLNVERCKGKTKVIHTFIPEWCIFSSILQDCGFWNNFINEEKLDICLVLDSEQLDYARDHHHYDIKTSNKYVKNILEFI